METPEEKRSRRLKKKEEKERRLRAKMGWDDDMMVCIAPYNDTKRNTVCNIGIHEYRQSFW